MIEHYLEYISNYLQILAEYEVPGKEITGPLFIALGSAGFCIYYKRELQKYIAVCRKKVLKHENVPVLQEKRDTPTQTTELDEIQELPIESASCTLEQVTVQSMFSTVAEPTNDIDVITPVESIDNKRDLLHDIHYTATISQKAENAERCIEMLMKYPEAVNSPREPYGFTPFLTACWAGSLTLVRYMLDHGANIELRTNDGDTPFYLAIRAFMETEERPNFSLLQLLLEAGASVNAINHIGYTPLHLAAANGSKSLVKWLIERGASPFQRNHYGYRPIDLAKIEGHTKVTSILTVVVNTEDSRRAKEEDSDSFMSSSTSASSFRRQSHSRTFERNSSIQSSRSAYKATSSWICSEGPYQTTVPHLTSRKRQRNHQSSNYVVQSDATYQSTLNRPRQRKQNYRLSQFARLNLPHQSNLPTLTTQQRQRDPRLKHNIQQNNEESVLHHRSRSRSVNRRKRKCSQYKLNYLSM